MWCVCLCVLANVCPIRDDPQESPHLATHKDSPGRGGGVGAGPGARGGGGGQVALVGGGIEGGGTGLPRDALLQLPGHQSNTTSAWGAADTGRQRVSSPSHEVTPMHWRHTDMDAHTLLRVEDGGAAFVLDKKHCKGTLPIIMCCFYIHIKYLNIIFSYIIFLFLYILTIDHNPHQKWINRWK